MAYEVGCVFFFVQYTCEVHYKCGVQCTCGYLLNAVLLDNKLGGNGVGPGIIAVSSRELFWSSVAISRAITVDPIVSVSISTAATIISRRLEEVGELSTFFLPLFLYILFRLVVPTLFRLASYF